MHCHFSLVALKCGAALGLGAAGSRRYHQDLLLQRCDFRFYVYTQVLEPISFVIMVKPRHIADSDIVIGEPDTHLIHLVAAAATAHEHVQLVGFDPPAAFN